MTDAQELADRLRNVQRQVMLEDLMMNDPVLGDEDPDVVANAYSTIMKLAPEVSGHKEVVRAILRQAVHSVAIDPFNAQSFADLEKSLLANTAEAVVYDSLSSRDQLIYDMKVGRHGHAAVPVRVIAQLMAVTTALISERVARIIGQIKEY